MLHVLQVKLGDGSAHRLVCTSIQPDPLDSSRVMLQGIQGLTFKWGGYWVQGSVWSIPAECVMSCSTGEFIDTWEESDLLRARPGKHQRLIAQIEADGGTVRLLCEGIRHSERFDHCIQLQEVYALLLHVGGSLFRVDSMHVPSGTLLNYVAGLVGTEFPLDMDALHGGDFSFPALPGTLPVSDIEAEPEDPEPEDPEPEDPEPEDPEPEDPEPEDPELEDPELEDDLPRPSLDDLSHATVRVGCEDDESGDDGHQRLRDRLTSWLR